ncbi:hypothetical protein A3Q34_00845 [Colwellia sp. PAMC 20917]|nr:hypothetical protein A3Q34_00845 [Colwellia sp. PAMC 20917]
MRIIDVFEMGPSLKLGNKSLLDIGRTRKLCGYSNPLRLRHTFAPQKMRTQAWGQRALWTPYFTNTTKRGVE